MTIALAMSIVTWVWVLAGAGLFVFIIYIAFTESPPDSEVFLLIVAAATGGIGAMVLGLSGAGFPAVAVWVWRIAGVTYLVAAIFAAAKGVAGSPTTTRRSSTAVPVLNIVVALLVSIPSWLTARAIAVSTASTAAPATRISYTIEGIRLWQGIALGMLALGTLVFLFLFVRMVERGVAPQLESHWGGIGGGLSGWRLSPSLTYLAAAAVFGVLFAIFVVQLDRPASKTPPPAQNDTTAAKQ